jgi:hypothetical protein
MNKQKNFVALEKAVCPVCGTLHETGAVFLHRHLHNIPKADTVTRYALCPEHKRLEDEGYIALVEAESRPATLADAVRTGNILHIKRDIWGGVFNTPCPDGPMVFAEMGTVDKIQARIKEAEATL